MSVDGTIYPRLVEETCLKPGYIRTATGNVSTLAGLKQAIQNNMLPGPSSIQEQIELPKRVRGTTS